MPNTFTNLHYHIVFSTKNRQPYLAEHAARMHEYLGGCVRTEGGLALRIGGISDHVHGLIRLRATHCLADLMRDIKRASSEWFQRMVPAFHWQDGYSAFTVSASHLDRVSRYIERQEKHHGRRPFADELRELLAANGIAFDERYLL